MSRRGPDALREVAHGRDAALVLPADVTDLAAVEAAVALIVATLLFRKLLG